VGERKKQLGAIDAGLIRRVDAARGDVSRIRWVERAIEQRLEAGDAAGLPFDDPPASARAPMQSDDQIEAPIKFASVDAPSRKPTLAQLVGRTGLPAATCRRALADGSWERL
jgi:hypothetical protein